MLLFGSIAPAGGNTGTNFWEFDQNLNPLININKTTGATGIYATAPSNEPTILATDDLQGSGTKISAIADNKNPNNNEQGIIACFDDTANGGDRAVTMLLTTTSAEHIFQLSETYSTGIGSKNVITNESTLRTQDYTSITEEVNDKNLNATQHNQNSNAQSFYFYNPTSGAAKATYQFDDTESQIKDGAGVKTFSVLKNGEIQTNQAIPHDNTINTLTWNMPLYDTTGTLLGYLKIFNK